VNRKQCIYILRDKLGYDWRNYIKSEVRWRRLKLGFSQRELGELVGCSPQYVSNLEGIGECSPKYLIAILNELQIVNIEAPYLITIRE